PPSIAAVPYTTLFRSISDAVGAKFGTKIRMAGVASTGPCCTRLPTGSTPLMPLYHRYHLHRFVDGHVLVSPPQGLSVPEPRPSIDRKSTRLNSSHVSI